jgi:hypothetical protein
MSAPVDEFDLDVRIGTTTDPLPLDSITYEYCPSDNCSAYPYCKTTERTCLSDAC